MSEILGTVNRRFDFDFTDADKIAVEQWAADMMGDGSIIAQARSNTFETFSMANADTVMEEGVRQERTEPEVLSKLLANAQAWRSSEMPCCVRCTGRRSSRLSLTPPGCSLLGARTHIAAYGGLRVRLRHAPAQPARSI